MFSSNSSDHSVSQRGVWVSFGHPISKSWLTPWFRYKLLENLFFRTLYLAIVKINTWCYRKPKQYTTYIQNVYFTINLVETFENIIYHFLKNLSTEYILTNCLSLKINRFLQFILEKRPQHRLINLFHIGERPQLFSFFPLPAQL